MTIDDLNIGAQVLVIVLLFVLPSGHAVLLVRTRREWRVRSLLVLWPLWLLFNSYGRGRLWMPERFDLVGPSQSPLFATFLSVTELALLFYTAWVFHDPGKGGRRHLDTGEGEA